MMREASFARIRRSLAGGQLRWCGVATLMAFVASPAMARDNWAISGSLAKACQIKFDCGAGDRCLQLRMDDRTSQQDTATIIWRCNFAVDNATLEFSSLNAGSLRLPEDELPLPYLIGLQGDQGSLFSEQSLVTPFRFTTQPGMPNVDISGVLQVRLAARNEALFAGRYSDRVTVTITPDAL